MAALTAARNTPRLGQTAQLDVIAVPVAAATTLYQGGIVCVNASGYAVPGSTATTLRVVGIAEKTFDNSAGAAGAITAEVRTGVFYLDNSGTDPVALANWGTTCYIVDDQTIAATSGTGTRSAAGIFLGLSPTGQAAVRLSPT